MLQQFRRKHLLVYVVAQKIDTRSEYVYFNSTGVIRRQSVDAVVELSA